MIENIQRRTTKLVPALKNLEYGDRLRALKLPSFYYRRARGDMIETYKYLHGIYKVDRMPLELDNNTVTRGHSLKLKKEHVTARQRRHYFRHRVVDRWNTLTEYVVSAPSLNIFKSRLDRFWCAYSFEQNDNFPPMCTNNCQDQLKGYYPRRAEEDVCMYETIYKSSNIRDCDSCTSFQRPLKTFIFWQEFARWNITFTGLYFN